MSGFYDALAQTVGKEGDYSNNAADRGGKTRFGITEAVARKLGYTGDMKDYPWLSAVGVYRTIWDELLCNQVAAASPAIAAEIFDTAVNCGEGTAVRFLQRALNALNNGATAYPDLAVDGIPGPASIDALQTFLAKRAGDGEKVLLKVLNGLQATHYLEICEKDQGQETFFFGWVLNRV